VGFEVSTTAEVWAHIAGERVREEEPTLTKVSCVWGGGGGGGVWEMQHTSDTPHQRWMTPWGQTCGAAQHTHTSTVQLHFNLKAEDRVCCNTALHPNPGVHNRQADHGCGTDCIEYVCEKDAHAPLRARTGVAVHPSSQVELVVT
jgi:hypothetical protein